MLGICFLEKGMPKLAVKWFEKGLTAPGRTEEEYQGLRYDLAMAHEAAGELDRALHSSPISTGRTPTSATWPRRFGSWEPALGSLDLALRDLGSHVTQAFSIMSSLLVGVVLVVAPWTTLWEANYLLQPHPGMRILLLSPFARGAVSGLGLVNILLALHEMGQLVNGRGERT